jgi:hypothetical protein
MRIVVGLFALITAARAAIGPPVVADPPHLISVIFKQMAAIVAIIGRVHFRFCARQ